MMRRILPFVLVAFPCLAIHVGAAKRTVTPDLVKHGPVYIAGFGNNRTATSVHDDLYARCMAFRAGKQRPLVICGVDSIGLFFDDVKKIRAKVDADVVVTATHNHEGPDTMGLWGPQPGVSGINEEYNAFVVERTAEAANAALGSLQPAELRFARFHSPEIDTFYDDSRPPVKHDGEIIAVAAYGRKGKVIGTLTNWNNHPESLDSKNREVSADYLNYFHPVLEEKVGGVSVFCNGAVGGMQSPLGAKFTEARQGTFPFAEALGNRVGVLTAEALAKGKALRIQRIVFREKLVAMPMANPGFVMATKAGVFKGRKQFTADNTSETPVGYIRFEAARRRPVLEVALIPGEMYPELSVGGIERYPGADFPDAPFEPPIKGMLSAPYKMLFGLANDEIGYIIPKAEWDDKAPWLRNNAKRWYGEVNSVGPETAPMIHAAFQELVKPPSGR